MYSSLYGLRHKDWCISASNKIDGQFSESDLELLEAMTAQAAIAIQSHVVLEQMEEARNKELEFMELVSEISSELELTSLLSKIISTITTMLDAERSSLFINDENKQLKDTVGSLRGQLEKKDAQRMADLQLVEKNMHNETNQLEEVINILREKLEVQHGNKK